VAVSSDSERRPRRRLSGAARRERILDAARSTFATSGYGATGMADVAAASGVTRAVLYDHFASRKALFLAVVDADHAAFMAHVAARIVGDGTAEERMRATMAAVLGFARAHPHAWRLLFDETTHGDPDLDASWRRFREDRTAAVAALLERDAAEAGIPFDGDRGRIIVEMLIGALTGAASWWHEHDATPQHVLIDAGIDLLWTGLGRGGDGAAEPTSPASDTSAPGTGAAPDRG